MTSVGMIGLGKIGLPMAQNLMVAGYPVVGFRRGSKEEFEAAGGRAARSAREVAEHCKVVFSCLPDEAALAEVVSGPQGLASGDCSGLVLVELSTLSEVAKARQAEALVARGGRMLDCAVSGIPRMVIERNGVVFVSGDEDLFELVRPQLDVISTKVFFMGGFGAAMKTKLCANMLVAINIASTAEMMTFGGKLGLDQLRLYEALKDGAGGSLQFTARGARMATGDWDTVMGSTSMLMKDITLIRRLGEEADVPMPILETAQDLYQKSAAEGLGGKDVAAVYATAARRAGLKLPPNNSQETN